ncbi:MAG: hypothetical protein U1E49_01220 [Hyphomicrobiaceae bacterium]
MGLEELTTRVDKLEDLIADIPSLLSLRLESLQAGHAETSGRLNLMDKQLANLTRDVRDLRGALTRQLLAQDAKLDAQDAKLEAQDAKLDALNAKLDAQDAKLDAILARLPQS